MSIHRPILTLVGVLWLVSLPRITSSAELAVDFSTDIKPILEQHCLECHGSEAREGGLLLTDRATALLPNDSGAIGIVPGDSAASELMRRIRSTDPSSQMPPDDRLSAEQIDLLRRWIEEGAAWPASQAAVHWAYQSPQRARLPAVRDNDWSRNAIDTFVLTKIEKHNLNPSEPADPARLVRRVYLDLVGTPPPIAVVDQFLADPSDAAYLQIVDRLLASTGYGEKWASPWLDLSRYSDSNGYQADQLRDMWAYRDWVIAALNQDMPFDRFTVEQLAGDLLPNAQISQRIATGFHRATTCNVEAGVDPEGNRTDQIIDRVNTTATVWLGTTFECAQCHNHKYDPFSQLDYYQLFAFFNNTPMEVRKANDNPNGVQFDFWGPKVELPQTEAQAAQRRERQNGLDSLKKQLKQVKNESLTDFPAWEADLSEADINKLAKPIKQAIRKSTSDRSKQDIKKLREHFWTLQPQVQELQERVKKTTEELEQLQPPTTLVMVEMSEPRASHIFVRGQFLNRGQKVEANTPGVLHPFPPDAPRNRLGLARWLTSNENPLVARVTVNRWWQEFFGTGLVNTPEDFGTQSAPPTHPKLLDWLACELMDQGWSMKSIHRLIVTSSTYRQSSRVRRELLERDPNNELLARGARFRLRAETIRDNALTISGLLSNNMSGPPAYPPQPAGLWRQTGRNEPVFETDKGERRYRRGVYVIWRRAAPYPSFINFDAPDRMACVVARSNTNTPLQALTLLNDEAYIEMAKALSHRCLRSATDVESQLRYAFRLCVARPPSKLEMAKLLDLFLAERARLENNATAVEQLAKGFDDAKKLTFDEKLRWAAMTSVANALLNLDETITRG